MNKIPVVFCFDDNLVLGAAIAINSLLLNSNPDTFYEIYVLHDQDAKFPKTNYFEPLFEKFSNFSLDFINVGDEFKDAFEIRGITIAAYYRLLIPRLLPQYDKIMYHDVDVIFQDDLTDIFLNTDMTNYYIAGVVSPACLDEKVASDRRNMGLDPFNYILSGNLIINSALMLSDDIVDKFKEEAKNKYLFQDQDVINIVCRGKIKLLPVTFCSTVGAFKLLANNVVQTIYPQEDLSLMIDKGIVHYNGPKPWSNLCPNFDIWWEYYRKSPYYSSKLYFDFFNRKMEEHDRLPLSKRLKILYRYFRHGRKSD
ncbi:glycosyltransferase family 8 protein [Sphingobacterium sp. DK4209]|uniref:Glycosyltransferase family 8 protein n=1 Tax=Sphingobacterium zhuxiongii TaxID=2662364 RepID=A0A5Q0QBX4_9SPHI|nr:MULTISPECIES: glycosyltransferase family 8 protein [unclassified Sphingobacterium]MVZ65281.1 glycosyltransferase family 8 protein [Sphingobacterium sp. DK4209]QGA26371.1 glycosyltransferase family 8 protein [Sphingobacterium sp. dk4302]